MGGRKVRSQVERFVLNCIESKGTDADWTIADAADAALISMSTPIPATKDLRAPWWRVDHQRDTGACVGFATARGVLRWHYVQAGWIQNNEVPSPRFIWMANKETDDITTQPTTFLESAGTQTKLALRVAQRYGCVSESVLPMDGSLSKLKPSVFYSLAAQLRITSYHNLGGNLADWRRWIALNGPILTRLTVDQTWDRAAQTRGHLKTYLKNTARGGHAVCLVGYTKDYFIVRNSWGRSWGDRGFGYAWNAYAKKAFTEAYGAVL